MDDAETIFVTLTERRRGQVETMLATAVTPSSGAPMRIEARFGSDFAFVKFIDPSVAAPSPQNAYQPDGTCQPTPSTMLLHPDLGPAVERSISSTAAGTSTARCSLASSVTAGWDRVSTRQPCSSTFSNSVPQA